MFSASSNTAKSQQDHIAHKSKTKLSKHDLSSLVSKSEKLGIISQWLFFFTVLKY